MKINVPETGNRLAIRLAILMTLALAPLGSIAVYSEYDSWKAQKEAHEAALIARSVDAVTGPRALLENAMISAITLAPVILDRIENPADCSEYLAEYVAQSGFYSFAGFIDPSGRMECVSQGDFLDLSDVPGFAEATENPRRNFTFQQDGHVTQRPVLLANAPAFRDDALAGFVTISISRTRFDMFSTTLQTDKANKRTYLVNHRGDVLSGAEDEAAEEMLPFPGQTEDLIAARNAIQTGAGQGGLDRLFTIAELMPGQLYVLGSWDPSHPQLHEAMNIWRFVFPVLMWLASIAVVMFAINYLVVRHLRQINGQLRRFALGYRDELQRVPDDAPRELREISTTFTKMALLIRRDEIERDEALREKTTLLKEVHHRVKNNLQLIASILNLQIRRLSDPQARVIMQGVQTRVRSLATIHRTLYQQDRVSETQAAEFFETILNETMAIAQSDMADIEVDAEFEPAAIAPDKIIPASLLFAEALSNAIKHAAPPQGEGSPRLRIRFSENAGHAQLVVRNSLAGPPSVSGSGGLGQELMTAFALQIHGDLEVGPVEDELGHGWEMKLRLATTVPDTTAPITGRVL